VAKPTITYPAIWNPAPVDAQTTGYISRIAGRLWEKAESLAACCMNLCDLRPNLSKATTDAVCTEANDIGNGFAGLVATTAGSHGV
jgi:hypothetical protein